jgi:hypothetical protein
VELLPYHQPENTLLPYPLPQGEREKIGGIFTFPPLRGGDRGEGEPEKMLYIYVVRRKR